MSERGYALFDTVIGRCGLAWTPAGVVGVSLPEASEGAAGARLARRTGASAETDAPPRLHRLITDIQALTFGEPVDLTYAVLDEAGAPGFDRAVYAVARAIPPGRTRTYGEIAADLGDKALARAVGQALGRNPWPIIVPCHRVLAAGGASGGFSARGGVATKLRLLTLERAATSPEPLLFDALPLAAEPRARRG